jgi:heme/copper-type cytochrome/quinol oxidase subunit 2
MNVALTTNHTPLEWTLFYVTTTAILMVYFVVMSVRESDKKNHRKAEEYADKTMWALVWPLFVVYSLVVFLVHLFHNDKTVRGH